MARHVNPGRVRPGLNGVSERDRHGPQPLPYATPARKDTRPPGGPVLTGATVGWRTAAGAAWLAGVVAGAGYGIATFYGQQQGFNLNAVVSPGRPSPVGIVCDLGLPAAAAVAVGAVAAVALYHWTARQLAWVAALPAVAGVWSGLVLAQDQTLGAGTATGLLCVVAVQAALVFAGTHLGRPVARWLARQVVPPPLRAAVVALWV